MWIVFSLAAALLASFNPIISKRLLADTDVSVVAWAGQAFGLPLLALNLILFFGPLPRVDGWFFIGILGSAILNTLAHLSATQALKEGESSLVAPLFVFSPAITFSDVTLALIFCGQRTAALPPRRTAMISARIETAISSGVGPPRSNPIGA